MDESKEVLAVIPARGGSKGIPHKNRKDLFGAPLVSWVIIACKRAKLVTRIVVSTDDERIAEIAAQHGVGVVARPEELATDWALTVDAVHHAVETLEADDGYRPEIVLCVQPTSPLTAPEDIDNLVAGVYPPYRSAVCMSEDHPFLWRQGLDRAGEPVAHDPRRMVMRQDLPTTYRQGGLFAWPREAMTKAIFLPHPTNIVEVPRERSIDIDDMTDWCVAEALLKRRSQ